MSINSDIKKFKGETEALFYNRLKIIERELLSSYKIAQKDIIGKLRALYDKLTVPMGENQLFNASQFNRLNNLEQQINEIIKELNRAQKITTGKGIGNEFAEGYYSIGYQLEGSLQANIRFGLLDPNVIKQSVANPLDRIGWQKRTNISNAKLTNQIRSEITSGLIQGNGYRETSKNISRNLGKHFSNDVSRIVRTETMRAQSWGNLTGHMQAEVYAKRTGIDIYRIWLSTLDERTRDTHITIDGQRENEAGNFTFSDGVKTAEPRMSGVAEHDIRCRCTTIDVVDNETPKMRRDNETKQLVPYKKYSEYKAGWLNKKKSPIKEPVNPLPKGKVPGTQNWKPSMTQAEADLWAKDSVIKESWYHNTSGKSANTIKIEGFSTGEDKIQAGRKFGDGVYLHEGTVKSNYAFSPFGTSQLKTKINVKNPYRLEPNWANASDKGSTLSKAIKYYSDNNLKRPQFSNDLLTRYLKRNNYDSLFSEEFKQKILVIFNPNNITVIK